MSICKGILRRLFPDAEESHIEELSLIWDKIIQQIIEKMIELSSPHIEELHINLREEMILELAKLQFFLGEKVVKDRLAGRSINLISADEEMNICIGADVKEKIENTALLLSKDIWIKRYNERWKPKTEAALQKEKNPKKTQLVPQEVTTNHYIPKFFIKRYWSKAGNVCQYRKINPNSIESSIISFGKWGHLNNLYSDELEAYFGLIEGDAVGPIEMLLKVEPLNRPQKEALIGFIVIQRLRNPVFISVLREHMRPIVEINVGQEQSNDHKYMGSVYETLYRDNNFYDRVARPVFENLWVIVRSKKPCFVLPDISNVFGVYEGLQYVIMPLTPNDCLIVMPIKETIQRIIPYYISPKDDIIDDLSNILISLTHKEFLGDESVVLDGYNKEDPNNIIQRIILSITEIINAK